MSLWLCSFFLNLVCRFLSSTFSLGFLQTSSASLCGSSRRLRWRRQTRRLRKVSLQLRLTFVWFWLQLHPWRGDSVGIWGFSFASLLIPGLHFRFGKTFFFVLFIEGKHKPRRDQQLFLDRFRFLRSGFTWLDHTAGLLSPGRSPKSALSLCSKVPLTLKIKGIFQIGTASKSDQYFCLFQMFFLLVS